MDIKNLYDAIIVGGGPAGLTAAIYLARACYRVLVIEKDTFGGQITITAEVVNYPGTGKISGTALTKMMHSQGEAFGAEYMKAEVSGIDVEGDLKTVHTDKGDFKSFSILVATGAQPRMIGFPGESDFRGRGVAYCATCDGEFFTGKEVFVVGGGFAAAEEAVFLTKYAKHVTILIRHDDFKCADSVADVARNHPKITVLTNTVVVEVKGDSALRSITYKNTKTNEEKTFSIENDTFGVFVFAGYTPASALVQGKLELNEQNYIITDSVQKTSVDGIYAAGDICVKNLRQVVTAVGDGAIAATEMEKYASIMQKKTGLKPIVNEVQSKTVPEAQKSFVENSSEPEDDNSLFKGDVLAQLNAVFAKMENTLTLELNLDNRPVSNELSEYINQLANLTDKLNVSIVENSKEENLPCVRILSSDNKWTGLAFHGVPGGHEFTSFILGLYNASGKGQPIDDDIKDKITKISKKINMKILVSLTCTMCPEVVTSAQKIASLNENITAQVYDLNHFEALKTKYNVMSVPCLIIEKDGKEDVVFGKKNIAQLMQIL